MECVDYTGTYIAEFSSVLIISKTAIIDVTLSTNFTFNTDMQHI